MSEMSIFGATVVGVTCKDGVILASEKRIAWNNMIITKNAKKIFLINDRIAIGSAGLTSDFQVLIRSIQAQINIYELQNRRKMSVKAVAKLISNILYQRKFMPLFVQTIIVGMDEDGPKLYTLDPAGSLIDDKYATAGTGSPVSIGVLEREYKDTLTVAQAEKMVVAAIKAGISRDAMSGDGIDLIKITNKGAKEKTVKL